MEKIVKNTTMSDIELQTTGVIIEASSSYTLDVQEYLLWATEDSIAEISPLVTSGDIVVSSGINDLSAPEGIAYLKYNYKGKQFLEYSFTDQTQPGIEIQSTIYKVVARCHFPGLDHLENVFEGYTISWQGASSGNYWIKIYDISNAQQIAESAAYSNSSPESINLGTLSNLPNDHAVFEIQAKAESGTKAIVDALSFRY